DQRGGRADQWRWHFWRRAQRDARLTEDAERRRAWLVHLDRSGAGVLRPPAFRRRLDESGRLHPEVRQQPRRREGERDLRPPGFYLAQSGRAVRALERSAARGSVGQRRVQPERRELFPLLRRSAGGD